MTKTKKQKWMWVKRVSVLYLRIWISEPIEIWNTELTICYNRGKLVFGSFRVGQIKKFHIPLKESK